MAARISHAISVSVKRIKNILRQATEPGSRRPRSATSVTRATPSPRAMPGRVLSPAVAGWLPLAACSRRRYVAALTETQPSSRSHRRVFRQGHGHGRRRAGAGQSSGLRRAVCREHSSIADFSEIVAEAEVNFNRDGWTTPSQTAEKILDGLGPGSAALGSGKRGRFRSAASKSLVCHHEGSSLRGSACPTFLQSL